MLATNMVIIVKWGVCENNFQKYFDFYVEVQWTNLIFCELFLGKFAKEWFHTHMYTYELVWNKRLSQWDSCPRHTFYAKEILVRFEQVLSCSSHSLYQALRACWLRMLVTKMWMTIWLCREQKVHVNNKPLYGKSENLNIGSFGNHNLRLTWSLLRNVHALLAIDEYFSNKP